MSTLLLLDILLAALAVFLVKKWRATSKASMKQFPPGPRPLPLLGNVLDMPATHQWKTFAEWQAKWGTSTAFFDTNPTRLNRSRTR